MYFLSCIPHFKAFKHCLHRLWMEKKNEPNVLAVQIFLEGAVMDKT
jgi:hypothetical protein